MPKKDAQKLKEYSDISLIYSNSAIDSVKSLKDRLEKSLGIEVEDSSSQKKRLYRSRSIISDNKWLKLSDIECSRLISREPEHYSKQVGIVDIPKKYITELRHLGIQDVSDLKALIELHKTPKFKELISFLIQYVSSFSFAYKKNIRTFPIAFNQPNLPSLTRKYPEGYLIGLHIDSWDYTDQVENREYTRNRFCINLGKEDRYLLFCPISVSGINKNLGMNLFREYQIYDFFKIYRECPIYRLRISPYQAYIAPTENLIHDGSSFGQKYADMHLTFLGYFNTVQLRSLP